MLSFITTGVNQFYVPYDRNSTELNSSYLSQLSPLPQPAQGELDSTNRFVATSAAAFCCLGVQDKVTTAFGNDRTGQGSCRQEPREPNGAPHPCQPLGLRCCFPTSPGCHSPFVVMWWVPPVSEAPTSSNLPMSSPHCGSRLILRWPSGFLLCIPCALLDHLPPLDVCTPPGPT